MADTPEAMTLDELAEAGKEIPDLTFLEANVLGSQARQRRLEKINQVAAAGTILHAARQRAAEEQPSQESVINIDAINDKEVLAKLEETETFEYEFAGHFTDHVTASRQEFGADHLIPPAPAIVARGTDRERERDIALGNFIRSGDNVPPAIATFTPEAPTTEPRRRLRDRFSFRRQPKLEQQPKPERRRRVAQLAGAVALATGVVATSIFGIGKLASQNSPETVAAAARAELQASDPSMDAAEKLGALLTVERQVVVEPIDFEAQQAQARAVITLAGMTVTYGPENVQALFDNLPE